MATDQTAFCELCGDPWPAHGLNGCSGRPHRENNVVAITAFRPATERGERDGRAADPAIVPPPSNPMAVARHWVEQHYTDRGQLVLRAHRGDFFRWDGACWPEVDIRTIRSGVYQWLESAVYERVVKADIVLVPYEPTRHKVDNVVDALRAVVHLDGSIEAPAWVNGAVDLPATEMVSMANGLLHVPTRTLLPHSPAFFSHHALPFSYDSEAPAPIRWLRFLADLWGDDQDSVDTLQEVMGYVIGGDTRQQKIFLLVGPRRGGKGTIGRVLTGLLGRHNVAAPTLSGLAQNFGLQELIDRPLGLISDARLGSKADSSVVVERMLSISGEDALTIDRKYRDPWTGRLPTRFVVLTNELPRLLDSSGALSSRFVLLVLTRSFLKKENPNLTNELLEEAPGILNWALEGLDRLNERGYFRMPESSREALVQLEDLSSPVSAFVRDHCEQGLAFSVPVDDLWSAWKSWCSEDNRHPGTKATFGRDLKAAAPTVRKLRRKDEAGHRWHEYSGIRAVDTMLGHGDLRDPEGQGEGHGPQGHRGHGDPAMYRSQESGCRSCAAGRLQVTPGGLRICKDCGSDWDDGEAP